MKEYDIESSISEFKKSIELSTYKHVWDMKALISEDEFKAWLFKKINPKEINRYGIDLSYYELDEDWYIISCCGERVDPDVMRCPTCKENV